MHEWRRVAWHGEESVILRVSVDGKRGGVVGKSELGVWRCEHMVGLAQDPAQSPSAKVEGQQDEGQQENPNAHCTAALCAASPTALVREQARGAWHATWRRLNQTGTHTNARPVVLDLEQLQAAVLRDHSDGGGLGVDAVLQELLERRRRAMDHFPRRDAIDHSLIQLHDRAHGEAGAGLRERDELGESERKAREVKVRRFMKMDFQLDFRAI